MCGILGIVNLKGVEQPHFKFFRKTLLESVVRGDHATGVASQSLAFFKLPGSSVKFLESEGYREWEEAALGQKWIVGHTRHSTQGDPSDNLNNHPLPVTIHGQLRALYAHNGIVGTSVETQKKAGLKQGEFFEENKHRTDSIVIGQAIQASWKEGDLFTSARNACKLFYGVAAVAVVGEHEMVFFRRYNPIVLAKLSDGSTAFASELRFLIAAAKESGLRIVSHKMMEDNTILSVNATGGAQSAKIVEVQRPYAANYSYNWQDYDASVPRKQTRLVKEFEGWDEDDEVVDEEDGEWIETAGGWRHVKRARYNDLSKPLVGKGWHKEPRRHQEAAFKAQQRSATIRDAKEFMGLDFDRLFKKKK